MTDPSAERPSRIFRLLVGYWLLALVTHVGGMYRPMSTDYSSYLRVVRDWKAGAVLYRDTYNNKTPVFYAWLRLHDSSNPALSLFLGQTILAALSAVVFRAALSELGSPLSGLIPAGLIVFSSMSATFCNGQTLEAPAMWFDVLTVSCLTLGALRNKPLLYVAGGLSFFLCVSFRPPALAHALAWLPMLWHVAQTQSFKRGLRAALLMMLGLFGGVAALCGYVWTTDYNAEFWVMMGRNVQYGDMNRVPLSTSLYLLGKVLVRRLVKSPIAAALFFLSNTLLGLSFSEVTKPQKRWLVTACLWLAAAIVGAIPGGRHYEHYYHFCWPGFSILCFLGLATLEKNLTPQKFRRFCAAILVGITAVAVAEHAYKGATARRDYVEKKHRWNEIEEAVAYLNEHTQPDTPVIVHVWMDWAELYWRVPRPAPSYDVPHVLPHDLFPEWMEETFANPPEWLVQDETDWNPIDREADAATLHKIQDFLDRNYETVKRIGTLEIRRRKKTGN